MKDNRAVKHQLLHLDSLISNGCNLSMPKFWFKKLEIGKVWAARHPKKRRKKENRGIIVF